MAKTRSSDRSRGILEREVGYIRKPHANRLRVALVFPNTYYVAMSNLGFQTVYGLFNEHDDIVCERAFLPPKQELAAALASKHRIQTVESGTPLGECDVIAFSVSFEWDYTNLLTILRLREEPAAVLGGVGCDLQLLIWVKDSVYGGYRKYTTTLPSGRVSVPSTSK